jgi:hypothetical protein
MMYQLQQVFEVGYEMIVFGEFKKKKDLERSHDTC